ncbi:T9SS type A sorting domain-containing protein [Taibaiella koreensis]|uniref:T9SS type A sorting domain-containing protein n=1 Tax=Taibaiella koreensis TaxID=1268548 RepID=UPI000E59D706|nr:T9SS type A sorting domain-containing protein [Taibaiella koreensis]
MTKLNLFAGLFALQGLVAVTAPAQTYLFKVGDASAKLQVADHIGGEELGTIYEENTVETYNLDFNGKHLIGAISFQSPANNIVYTSHHGLTNTSDYLRQLKGYEPFISGQNGVNVLAERVNDKGDVKAAVFLHYDENGKIIKPVQLPSLPPGYSFLRIFDMIEYIDLSQGPKRILCLLEYENTPFIAELLYVADSAFYRVRRYKMVHPPKSYQSVHYVRAYHFNRSTIGNPSFYGLMNDGKVTSAFCYYEPVDSPHLAIFERYDLSSVHGIKGVTGVQMSGDYGQNGVTHRIEMAFTDEEGGICIQQRDTLVTTQWQRFYQFPDKVEFRLASGRDGMATKRGPGLVPEIDGYERGYFLGAEMPTGEPDKARVAALHYDGNTGALKQSRVYDISGKSVFKDGGFPSTSYDPGRIEMGAYIHNYTFIADEQEEANTFRRGTGNSMIVSSAKFFCSEPHKILPASNKRLNITKETVYVDTPGLFDVKPIELDPYEVAVTVTLECAKETGVAPEKGIADPTPSSSALQMDAARMQVSAKGKNIAAIQILSIDGRTLVQEANLSTNRYEHAFSTLLVPGIYVVRISYTDHTTEAKKVSIY